MKVQWDPEENRESLIELLKDYPHLETEEWKENQITEATSCLRCSS